MAKKHDKGFTLIETMVALAVLTFTLTGMVSLIILNITNAKNIEKNLVAGNLAQEGLEIVRAMRDKDWLEGNDFGSFLPADGEYIVQWNDSALRSLGGNPVLRIDSNTGIYGYDSGDPTMFKRKVLVQQLSDREIKVLVTVEWQLRGRTAELQAESYLFNWY